MMNLRNGFSFFISHFFAFFSINETEKIKDSKDKNELTQFFHFAVFLSFMHLFSLVIRNSENIHHNI